MRLKGFPAAVVFAYGLVLYSCVSDSVSTSTREQIRKSHNRMLTVDGRVAADRVGEFFSRMPEGGLDAAFLIVAVPPGGPTPEGRQAARDAAMRGVERIKRLVERRSRSVSLALAPEDAYRLEKEGRRAVFIGLEPGGAIGLDPSMMAEYRSQGVRCLCLSGAAESVDRGLGDLGRGVVAECNRVGLIINAVDCPDRTLADVLAASRAPVVVSRGAARTLCDRPGNLSDGTIRAVAAAGGVILVSFEPGRLVAGDRAAQARATVGDVADHIKHLIRIAGAQSVGIGSGFGDGGGIAGCRDAGDILNLTVELLRRGLVESELEAVWGGNLMRVFRRVEDLAAGR